MSYTPGGRREFWIRAMAGCEEEARHRTGNRMERVWNLVFKGPCCLLLCDFIVGAAVIVLKAAKKCAQGAPQKPWRTVSGVAQQLEPVGGPVVSFFQQENLDRQASVAPEAVCTGFKELGSGWGRELETWNEKVVCHIYCTLQSSLNIALPIQPIGHLHCERRCNWHWAAAQRLGGLVPRTLMGLKRDIGKSIKGKLPHVTSCSVMPIAVVEVIISGQHFLWNVWEDLHVEGWRKGWLVDLLVCSHDKKLAIFCGGGEIGSIDEMDKIEVLSPSKPSRQGISGQH